MFNIDKPKKLYFWCNKILPLVYDESMTYYEVLCRTQQKLNEVINFLDEYERAIYNYVDNRVQEMITWTKDYTAETLENFRKEFQQYITQRLDDYTKQMQADLDEFKKGIDKQIADTVANVNKTMDETVKAVNKSLSDTKTEIHSELEEYKDIISADTAKQISDYKDAVDSALASINISLETLDSTVIELRQSLDALSRDFSALYGRMEKAESSIRAIKANEANIASQITSINEKLEDQLTQIKALATTVNTINTDLGTIHNDITLINGNIDSLQHTTADHETRIKALEDGESSIPALTTEVNNLKLRVDGNTSDISDLTNTINLLDSDLTGLIETVGRMQTSIAQNTNDIQTMSGRLDNFDVTLEDVNNRLVANVAQTTTNRDDIATIKNNISSINNDIVQINQNYETVTDSLLAIHNSTFKAYNNTSNTIIKLDPFVSKFNMTTNNQTGYDIIYDGIVTDYSSGIKTDVRCINRVITAIMGGKQSEEITNADFITLINILAINSEYVQDYPSLIEALIPSGYVRYAVGDNGNSYYDIPFYYNTKTGKFIKVYTETVYPDATTAEKYRWWTLYINLNCSLII